MRLIFQDGGRANLGLSKFEIFNVRNGQGVELRNRAKFCQNRSNCGRYMVIFDFLRWLPPPSWIFGIFNVRSGQAGRTATPCQISSKSFEPQPRYVSFNIMLIWLENAYSRSLWGFSGHIFPK